jgi:hemerythrin superfamily protein
MANASNSTQSGAPRPAPRSAKVVSSGTTGGMNAIELLKADHRQVEGWFADLAASDDIVEKEELAWDICQALTVHTGIEEEIFYPAFLDAVGDEDMYDDAIDDHDEVKDVIEEIEALDEGDVAGLGAKIGRLAAMIRDHVLEEERPDGMFDRAQKSGMDLEELGAQLERRKLELMSDDETDAGYDEAVETDAR